MYLIYDTETTGLPQNYNAPISDTDNWPRLVQLAWQLHDSTGKLINRGNKIVQPEGFTIPFNSVKIHGISTERAESEGFALREVMDEFLIDVEKADIIIGHNIEFDINIVGCEMFRLQDNTAKLLGVKTIDTKEEGTEFCAIPGGRGGKFKWPTLAELHRKLFDEDFGDAHDAAYDVDATAKCFFGLLKEKVIPTFKDVATHAINYEAPKLEAANFAKKEQKKTTGGSKIVDKTALEALKESDFTHLHCHTQFSILQSTTEVNSLVQAAVEMEMPAIAMTDTGNMMAAFHFVRAARKADILPIVGCEFFITDDRKDKSRQNNGDQVVLLAKNKAGYHNLAKLASYANIEGFYYVPRIDRSLLLEYKNDLIATTGGIWGDVPNKILNIGDKQAEESFKWWKDNFGDDFYAELNRHKLEEEDIINKTLLKFCKKYDVKYFAANNTFYTTKDQAAAHDILLCVKDGATQSTPKKFIGSKGREFRFGFPNNEFYIKSPSEMKALFADLPEAILTTQEITAKIEGYELARDVLLPAFDIPEQFQDPKDKEDSSLKIGENNFLRHLTYEGAKERYGEMTPEITERLDFELSVIANTGYPGYFLIVQDFISEARRMDVSVGPGRGSAAGSAVAYCTGITNIDPIKYDLLFERFLNPERVSMPDIDIDFDDEGRGRVIQYVIDKYGSNQVAQIITYGTMAAKSSIRDTARALQLDLPSADTLAKLIPDLKLAKIFGLSDHELAAKLKNNQEDILRAKELKNLARGNDLRAQTINQARVLEGSVRNVGIHACGVIITPDDITNFVPVALAKDSEMFCTQFDNSVVEDAGLLKMDFLGLKTLTLIKDAIKIVKERHGVQLDAEKFPIDDLKTYELFQRGETVGIFQYESVGMQKYMRQLKPTVFADLIAMNALYRPGPLEYIPNFIRRKHGEEEIVYDIPETEEYLAETYGITVYQEQVMLLSQSLAGFTKGEADTLRKAMGKKIMAMLEKLKPKFVSQAMAKGHPEDKLEKIWKDWEAFASYAFNKSHSTCYAWVAYQTAYLKAHYPAEYMAAVLSNNMNDISSVSFFMEECKRMGIQVLGPDVNESKSKFTVNKEGAIRFGLAAIKGAGKGAVQAVIDECVANGEYTDFFDFAERLSNKSVNKKTYEVLAQSGGFDSFTDYHRKQFLYSEDGPTLIESAIKYASKQKAEQDSNQGSLFGASDSAAIAKPKPPKCEPFTNIEQLNLEKEVVGLFITGHPLDQFRIELDNFCGTPIGDIQKPEPLKEGEDETSLRTVKERETTIGGMITAVREGISKNGKPYAVVTVEDYSGSVQLFLIGDRLMNNKSYVEEGLFVFVNGKIEMNYRKRKEIKENPQLKPTTEDYEFSASKFSLLGDVRERMCKGLEVTVGLEDINDDFITNFMALLQQNPGKLNLNLNITSNQHKLDLGMASRKLMVSSENDFFEQLREVPEIDFKVLS